MERVMGMIGLGIMGEAMARNLVAGGWRVLGYDPAVSIEGVEMQPDAAAVARGAPVVMTSLAAPAALRATAAALAEAPPHVVVEASTMALEDKLAFAGALPRHTVLDCPISGTGAQAVRRDLVVYASGDTAAIKALGPFFDAFTRAHYDLGAYGNGSRMKFVANLLVAVHNVASAEAMVLGMRAGLDPAQIIELIGAGVGTSRVFELRAPMMAAGRYEPATMKVEVWQKDMAIIGAFAKQLGVATPLLDATAPVYDRAMAEGRGAEDTAAVCAVLQGMERS